MEFKELLRKQHVTQSSVAAALGVTQSLVSQWVSGACEPKARAMLKISEILNVSVEEVISCFAQGR